MEPTVDFKSSAAVEPLDMTKRVQLRSFFNGRLERLEQLENIVQRGPVSPETRARLQMLRRARFSTWLDLQALEEGDEAGFAPDTLAA